jgi:hypothetical protein
LCWGIDGWDPGAVAGRIWAVSVYAFDSGRGVVVVTWPAAAGWVAHDVAPTPADAPERDVLRLCATLTAQSRALWDVYVRPASSFDDAGDREQREDERQRFDVVVAAVRSPNLPDPHGLLEVSYSPVEESAHRVGRVLHDLADPALTAAVATDAGTEVDAVVRAELGDLTGRAVQACVLDRLDVSPLQVAAADDLLRADPLSDVLLSAAIDPAAACVAVAHWLAAAAVVAADSAGSVPAAVFAEADDIEQVSIEIPSRVVNAIEADGRSPRTAVLELLQTAVAAAHGEITDLPGVLAERSHLEQILQRVPADQRDAARAGVPARATLLDPRRPARDLLEHLLDGIGACHLLFAEYADDELDADDLDHDDDDLSDEAGDDERQARVAAEFAEAVRDRAQVTHSRLF